MGLKEKKSHLPESVGQHPFGCAGRAARRPRRRPQRAAARGPSCLGCPRQLPYRRGPKVEWKSCCRVGIQTAMSPRQAELLQPLITNKFGGGGRGRGSCPVRGLRFSGRQEKAPPSEPAPPPEVGQREAERSYARA